MGFFSVMLWPLFSPPGTTLAGLFFVGPVLAGFCRDWLVVSGRLDPTSPRYLALTGGLSRLLERWLLPLLRLGLVFLSVLILLPAALEDERRQALLRWPGGPSWSAELVALLALAATLLLALGILARLAALGLLVPTAMVIVSAGLTAGSGLLLAGSILVMLLGGGALVLWRPDDTFVTRRAGERRTP
jgi:CDP-diacylglycerol--glycerol-3-phosphate 3-phosphatidyltransferase